mmetsp:Transcript_49301/g.107311  ORF Transcript_49301/g.107311 Transcript_49301/m.107311 type:complete len:513 (-) Transcript_49301:6-1544(-)
MTDVKMTDGKLHPTFGRVESIPHLGHLWESMCSMCSMVISHSERSSSFDRLNVEKAYDQWMQGLKVQEEQDHVLRERRRQWTAEGGWPTAPTGGQVGLTNIKTTCWMNAIVQCLAQIVPFTEQFLQEGANSEVTAADLIAAWAKLKGKAATTVSNSNGKFDKEGPAGVGEPMVAMRLRELLQTLWQERQMKPISPWRFHVSLTANLPWHMRKAFSSPQDAQEFFIFLLNKLHDEFAAAAGSCTGVAGAGHRAVYSGTNTGPPTGSDSRNVFAKANANGNRAFLGAINGIEKKGTQIRGWRSPVQRLFQGNLESTLTCSECGYSSKTREEFMHLAVPVPQIDPPGSITLDKALDDFTAEEHLQDPWNCSKCDGPVDATKSIGFVKLPPVVVLNFKRSAYDSGFRAVGKVQTLVNLPDCGLRGLDLSRFAAANSACSSEPALYDIIGVVNHIGYNVFCGHYTASCLHCVEGKWYAYDDTRVTAMSEEEVWHPKEVYMVILLRRGYDRPLRQAAL